MISVSVWSVLRTTTRDCRPWAPTSNLNKKFWPKIQGQRQAEGTALFFMYIIFLKRKTLLIKCTQLMINIKYNLKINVYKTWNQFFTCLYKQQQPENKHLGKCRRRITAFFCSYCTVDGTGSEYNWKSKRWFGIAVWKITWVLIQKAKILLIDYKFYKENLLNNLSEVKFWLVFNFSLKILFHWKVRQHFFLL